MRIKGKILGVHESKKAVFSALGANFGIAVFKGIAAFITMSASMLADMVIKESGQDIEASCSAINSM